MSAPATRLHVDITTRGDVSPADVEKVRGELSAIGDLVKGPVLGVRATLVQEANPRLERPARGQAMVDLAGCPVFARVAEPTMQAAADELVERMRRNLRRYVDMVIDSSRGRQEPGPGEWYHGAPRSARPEHFPRPAGERHVVRRKTFALGELDAVGAIAAMQMLDHDFLLYRDADTAVDAVAYTRDDGRLGVIVPRGTPPPFAEGPVWEESRFRGPISEETAVAEMSELEHRFLFFVNEASGRGNVIYLRYDGHYGLIQPSE